MEESQPFTALMDPQHLRQIPANSRIEAYIPEQFSGLASEKVVMLSHFSLEDSGQPASLPK